MAQNHGGSRDEIVRALLAQRRQASSAPGVAAAAEKQARVQQLLQQRRLASSTGNAGPTLAASIGAGLHAAGDRPDSRDGLLSPDSSTMSFEFDRPAGAGNTADSTARLLRSASEGGPTARIPTGKGHGAVTTGGVAHARPQHMSPIAETQPQSRQSSPHDQPVARAQGTTRQTIQELRDMLHAQQQLYEAAKARGVAASASSPGASPSGVGAPRVPWHGTSAGGVATAGRVQAAVASATTAARTSTATAGAMSVGVSATRHSKAELEARMSQAMFQMSVERNPAVRSADGGPFDISELWSAGGSQPSATQSETSGVGQDLYSSHVDEVSSRPSDLQPHLSPHSAQGPVGVRSHGVLQQGSNPATAAGRGPAEQKGKVSKAAKAQGGAARRDQPTKGAPHSPAAAAAGAGQHRGGPKPRPSAPVGPALGRPASPARGPTVPITSGLPGAWLLDAQAAAAVGAGGAELRRKGATAAGGAQPRSQSAPRARPTPLVQAGHGTASLVYQPGGLQVPGGSRKPGLGSSEQVEFTFRPQINESSREMIRLKYPRDREDRILQLAVPRAAQLQKYEAVRQEAEEAKLKECTFTPRTGRPPSPARVRREGPVHERLYQAKPAWEEKRDQLVKEREVAALADCTFRPEISRGTQRRASSAGRVPLHMRVADVLRHKNENLSNARIRMELADEGITFQPAINRKSVQLVLQKQGGQSDQGVAAGERLYQAAMQRPGKAGVGSDEAECTFAPAINERSRKLLARSMELPSSFLERQQYLAALAAEKRALYRSVVEAEECSFTPAVRSTSVSPTPSRQGSLAASGHWAREDLDDTLQPRDRITKLAYQDVRKSAALKDALSQHYYGQFSFTPDINPKSRVIGKHHSVEDLHRNESGRVAKERASQAVLGDEVAECTFRPALNPRSLKVAEMRRSHGSGPPSLLDRVDPERLKQARSVKLQEARALQEYEELRECTFTPEVLPGAPDFRKGPASVPGLSRHLELQQMAKKKKEEERKRQEQVWWQQPQGPSHLFTVPQPFTGMEARQAALRQSGQWKVKGGQAGAGGRDIAPALHTDVAQGRQQDVRGVSDQQQGRSEAQQAQAEPRRRAGAAAAERHNIARILQQAEVQELLLQQVPDVDSDDAPGQQQYRQHSNHHAASMHTPTSVPTMR